MISWKLGRILGHGDGVNEVEVGVDVAAVAVVADVIVNRFVELPEGVGARMLLVK